MAKQIHITREYPHPTKKVWYALTNADAIAEWLMENDFKLEVGHKFTLRTDPGPGFDGIVHCEVTNFEVEKRLCYSWKGGPIDTQIEFLLSPTASGTKLTVTQTGFKGLKANLVRLILKAGSKKIYGQFLPGVLDRLSDDGTIAPVPVDPNCKKGLWAVLAKLFSPILSKKD